MMGRSFRRPVGRARLFAFVACSLVLACRPPDIDPTIDGDRPTRRLVDPAGEFSTPFGAVRAVMALPDDRLVVSDPQENRIALIDYSKGTSTSLSRQGGGPREFRRPGGLYRGPRGGVLVFDQGLMRLLPIAAGGAVANSIGLPTGGIPGDWSTCGPDPLAFDSVGQTYEQQAYGRPFSSAAVVLRYRPGVKPDTVARLVAKQTKSIRVNRNGTGTYQDVLFSPEDGWLVAPDGWIALARAEPYHVEWVRPDGPSVVGPVIHHEPIPIPKAEKELIACGEGGPRGRSSVTLVLIGPGGPPPSQPANPTPIPVDELLFAKAKTPVNLRAGRWPLLDERGRIWVERSTRMGTTSSVFDVFDRTGALVDRVEIPAGLRLVGFDADWAYVARKDADDLEYLHRLALPQ